jgi:outer membrane protein
LINDLKHLYIFLLSFSIPFSILSGEKKELSNWSYKGGMALVVSPLYPGSKRIRVLPVPYIKAKYKDMHFSPREISWLAFENKQWRTGIASGWEFGRDESDAHKLEGLGGIDATVVGKAFVRYKSLSKIITSSLNFTQDLGNSYSGYTINGTLGLNAYVAPWSTLLSVGWQSRFADEQYMQAYYGVDTVQAMNSAYKKYNLGSSVSRNGLYVMAIKKIENDRVFNVIFSYDRLRGSASRSPIIDTRHQFSTVLSYSAVF